MLPMTESRTVNRPVQLRELQTARAKHSSTRAKQTASRAVRTVGSTSGMLFGFTLFLTIFGLVMALSASSIFALKETGSAYTIFLKQLVWVGIGFAAFAVMAFIDYRIWRRWAFLVFFVCIFLMLLLFVPGIGVTEMGSTRWLRVGSMRIQPSEPAKLGFLLVSALVLSRKESLLHDSLHALIPIVFPMLTMIAILLLLQPDLGTTLVFCSIALFLLCMAGVRVQLMGALFGLAVSASLVLIAVAPYRMARVRGVFDPLGDAQGDGYQLVQSIIALISGGWTGTGLGASRQKWSWLPNPHNDFIFAIIGEELGLIGALVVLVLTFGLVLFCAQAARRAPDTFGRLIASGVAVWIAVQAVMNIGAVIGLLPITGVVLPLVSQGGTSAFVLLASLGIVISVAREGDKVVEKKLHEHRQMLAKQRKNSRA